jgi:CheY-like chemotaxis protein
MAEVSILLVGNTRRAEFLRAREMVDRLGCTVEAANIDAAEELLTAGKVVPQLIVIAQAYPHQFSHEAVDRLRRLAPLARLLGLLGSWCEGEQRTGMPWPAVVRVYWHQWPGQCHRQLSLIDRGESSAWTLPVTATEEERLLLDSRQPIAQRSGLVAVHTRVMEMEDWLSAALRSRGCSTVWLQPSRPMHVEGAAAALFDGSDMRGGEVEELEALCRDLAPTPVIVLLDFPRIEDHNRALTAGAAAVVSKPVQIDDLFWELDRVLEIAAV